MQGFSAGSIPGPERLHMLQGNQAHPPQFAAGVTSAHRNWKKTHTQQQRPSAVKNK